MDDNQKQILLAPLNIDTNDRNGRKLARAMIALAEIFQLDDLRPMFDIVRQANKKALKKVLFQIEQWIDWTEGPAFHELQKDRVRRFHRDGIIDDLNLYDVDLSGTIKQPA